MKNNLSRCITFLAGCTTLSSCWRSGVEYSPWGATKASLVVLPAPGQPLLPPPPPHPLGPSPPPCPPLGMVPCSPLRLSAPLTPPRVVSPAKSVLLMRPVAESTKWPLIPVCDFFWSLETDYDAGAGCFWFPGFVLRIDSTSPVAESPIGSVWILPCALTGLAVTLLNLNQQGQIGSAVVLLPAPPLVLLRMMHARYS